MKGLRYVIALFHVALIARANIENNNPGIIIVIMSAPVIIVNVIKSTIVIIVGQPALNTIIVIKMFDSSYFHLSVIELYSATSRAPRLLGAIFCSLSLSLFLFFLISLDIPHFSHMDRPPLFSKPDTFSSVPSTSQHGPLAPPSSFQILSAPPLHPDILSQLLLHIPPIQPTLHTASPYCLLTMWCTIMCGEFI